MTKVIVTGGTGFLGYELIKLLTTHGVFVYAIVRKNSSRLYKLDGMPNIKVVEHDLENSDRVEGIDGAQAFYHLAWGGERDDMDAQLRNLAVTINAFNFAKNSGIQHFIATGSQAEYGLTRNIITEATPPLPVNCYGTVKLAAFNLLREMSEQANLPFTWVRVFSAYGKGDASRTLISRLKECCETNMQLTLTSCTQYWDYIHVHDVSEALMLLGERRKTGLYNLSGGDSQPLKHFVETLVAQLNPNLQLTYGDVEGEVNLRTDITKLRHAIEWSPKIKFDSGVLML